MRGLPQDRADSIAGVRTGILFRFLFGEPEDRPQRRRRYPSDRAGSGQWVCRWPRRSPASVRVPAARYSANLDRSRRPSTKGLRQSRATGGNNEQTWHNPWRRKAPGRRRTGSLVPGMEPTWKRRRRRNSLPPISATVRGRIEAAARAAGRADRRGDAGRGQQDPSRRRRARRARSPGSACLARTGCRRRLPNFRRCAANFPIWRCI